MANPSPNQREGWTRRKVAWLGFALWLPFPALLAIALIGGKLLPGSMSAALIAPLFVLMIPFSFVGFGGFILLLAAWFTPKGKRPFVDPIKLW